MREINKFQFQEYWFLSKIYSIKKKLLNLSTKNSADIFLRKKDMISIEPLIGKGHETGITRLIEYASLNNYSDFLIDIGANIGLTSYQNGINFEKLFLFEPNPLAFKILEVNMAISFNSNKYKLFNIGLGVKNSKEKLLIPKHNWGEAFVLSKQNDYGNKTLAQKDGFKGIELNNYIQSEIRIKKASIELKKNFNSLAKKSKGVIKIDVEGFELQIIKELAKVIPRNFKIIIIFESLNAQLDLNKVLKLFKSRVRIYKLIAVSPCAKLKFGILREFCFRPKVYSLVTEFENTYGDLVIELSN